MSLNREPWSETRQIVATTLDGVNPELLIGSIDWLDLRGLGSGHALWTFELPNQYFTVSAEAATTVPRDRSDLGAPVSRLGLEAMPARNNLQGKR